MRLGRTLRLVLALASIVQVETALGLGFEHISLQQGLSQSSVFAICQDHLGFLWFGTQDGLDRYDGYSFKVFRNNRHDSTSLSYNYVLRLMVARNGSVWAGTEGGGVSVYNQITGRFTQYMHVAGKPNSLSNNHVHALYQDPDGTIWVGTEDGLDRFDSSGGTFRRYYFRGKGKDTTRDNFISSIFEDSEHRFWVCSINGASLLNVKTGAWSPLQPRGIVINKVVQTSHGELLFIGAGVWSYDSLSGRLVPWKTRLTNQIEKGIGSEAAILNKNGTMWLGSYDGIGLVGVNTDTVAVFRNNPNDPTSLSENTILSLYQDRSGILWVGTYEGINKYVPTKKKFENYTFNPKDANSLSNMRVRGFSQARDGMIWIATQNGLDGFDPSTGRFSRYFNRSGQPPSGPARTFWSVLVNRESNGISVWGGTNGQGIYTLTFRHGISTPIFKNIVLTMPAYKATFSDVVNSLYQDRQGNIWAGTYDGVIRLTRSGAEYKQTRYPFPSQVNVIFQDSSGTMWIGGYSFRLHRFDSKTDKFERAILDSNFANTLAGKSVLCMAEGRDRTLWVGTYGGLLRINYEGKLLSHIGVSDGLPNDVIYAILVGPHGHLWLSTDLGICRYSPLTGRIRDYTVDDGLQSNEFNQGAAFESRSGKFYFGGINGFNSFYPDSIHDNTNIPPVVFTGFKIFNRSVEPRESESPLQQTIWTAHSLHLSYTDEVLTFDFAALEFTDPDRNMYAYKLDGFDRRWENIGDKREVTYTNLDPGRYVLRVRASNNDGVWNNKGASLIIYISPPLWMTWWFRGLVVLIFLSIGPIIYYRRVTTLKREAAVQREFSRKLIDRQENERNRIAAELHDTIGQDLLVIKNRAYLAQQAKRLNSSARTQLDNIVETVTQSLQNVREIVRNLRPYYLDRIGLTGALNAMLASVGESSSIRFDVSIDNIDGMPGDGSKESEASFFRIVQESVNNLVKHSGARNASVAVRKHTDEVVAIIHDDGKGFDYAATQGGSSQSGLGLSSMIERAGMLGGHLEISSGQGSGTTITLTVPVYPRNEEHSERQS